MNVPASETFIPTMVDRSGPEGVDEAPPWRRNAR